jgi:hypothetical protein
MSSKNNGTKEITPKEYFELLKTKKSEITDDELKKIYSNCLTLMKKYVTTGQVKGAKKLMFHLETIEKEREIVSLGINTFIYKDDIEDYIDNVANDVVKIIELENYEREIPDEIVDVIEATKDKFDQLYIIFTDYTGKIEKQIEKERREKDPILFGTFQDKKTGSIVDRFYVLGDWEDEYCDLTLDKLVNEMKVKRKKAIDVHISTPETIEELKAQLANLDESNNNFTLRGGTININTQENKSFFKKVKSFLKCKK